MTFNDAPDDHRTFFGRLADRVAAMTPGEVNRPADTSFSNMEARRQDIERVEQELRERANSAEPMTPDELDAAKRELLDAVTGGQQIPSHEDATTQARAIRSAMMAPLKSDMRTEVEDMVIDAGTISMSGRNGAYAVTFLTVFCWLISTISWFAPIGTPRWSMPAATVVAVIQITSVFKVRRSSTRRLLWAVLVYVAAAAEVAVVGIAGTMMP